MLPKTAFLVNLISILLIYTQQSLSHAYPDGAGSCELENSVGDPHITPGKGSISNGGYEVLINDVALEDTVPINLQVGLTHKIEVRVNPVYNTTFFRGFLIRASKPDVDLSGALSILASEKNDAQIMPAIMPGTDQWFGCPLGIVGLTHADRNDKNSIVGELTLPFSSVGEVSFAVTIVKKLTALEQDFWYSTNFIISAFNAPPEITAAPTKYSLVTPITDSPSFESIQPPTLSPANEVSSPTPSYSPIAPITDSPSFTSIQPPASSPIDEASSHAPPYVPEDIILSSSTVRPKCLISCTVICTSLCLVFVLVIV